MPCRELEKIKVEGDALYLPTDPTKLVKGIELDSGIPLQSAAKVPIMITFDVVDKEGDQDLLMRQACIFKVGSFILFLNLLIEGWLYIPGLSVSLHRVGIGLESES